MKMQLLRIVRLVTTPLCYYKGFSSICAKRLKNKLTSLTTMIISKSVLFRPKLFLVLSFFVAAFYVWFHSAPVLLVTLLSGTSLRCFNVLLPSTSIIWRQPNLPLASTSWTRHFSRHRAISPPICHPIPSSPPCLILKICSHWRFCWQGRASHFLSNFCLLAICSLNENVISAFAPAQVGSLWPLRSPRLPVYPTC